MVISPLVILSFFDEYLIQNENIKIRAPQPRVLMSSVKT